MTYQHVKPTDLRLHALMLQAVGHGEWICKRYGNAGSFWQISWQPLLRKLAELAKHNDAMHNSSVLWVHTRSKDFDRRN